MSINFLQKQIYNCYLKNSRHGQPWTPRKNFDDLDNSTIFFLKKLDMFFSKFKHINLEDFFSAPLVLHPDESYPPLKFFSSRAAIKSYTLFNKHKENQSPQKLIDETKNGLIYIANFCIKNKIQMRDYITTKIGMMPVWSEHYRQHHINPYCLMELGTINFKEYQSDEKEIWINDLEDKFTAFKNRYHQCSQTKEMVKKTTSKLTKFVEDELTKK